MSCSRIFHVSDGHFSCALEAIFQGRAPATLAGSNVRPNLAAVDTSARQYLA